MRCDRQRRAGNRPWADPFVDDCRQTRLRENKAEPQSRKTKELAEGSQHNEVGFHPRRSGHRQVLTHVGKGFVDDHQLATMRPGKAEHIIVRCFPPVGIVGVHQNHGIRPGARGCFERPDRLDGNIHAMIGLLILRKGRRNDRNLFGIRCEPRKQLDRCLCAWNGHRHHRAAIVLHRQVAHLQHFGLFRQSPPAIECQFRQRQGERTYPRRQIEPLGSRSAIARHGF